MHCNIAQCAVHCSAGKVNAPIYFHCTEETKETIKYVSDLIFQL